MGHRRRERHYNKELRREDLRNQQLRDSIHTEMVDQHIKTEAQCVWLEGAEEV